MFQAFDLPQGSDFELQIGYIETVFLEHAVSDRLNRRQFSRVIMTAFLIMLVMIGILLPGMHFLSAVPECRSATTFQDEATSSGKVPYLISAGPRQPRVWGSRMRPLPQPPTRSTAKTLGIVTVGSSGAKPAVTTLGNAGFV